MKYIRTKCIYFFEKINKKHTTNICVEFKKIYVSIRVFLRKSYAYLIENKFIYNFIHKNINTDTNTNTF